MKKLAIVAAIAMAAFAINASAAGDAAAGKAKAAACAGCHGANGEGVAPNPKLAGLAPDKFVAAMKAFKDGTRASPIMKSFATGSDQDFADLAAYYASLK
ncbi:MAG: c-type cytochrome [Gammaproteobacteria bacterium]|jgi:cytochrome c553|nr:c-type cytochrome [Gammaproteobacteria bacterium]